MACADLALDALSGEYEVVRLPPNAAVPPDLFSSAPADALVSVTRTADELSLLRPAAGAVIPVGATAAEGGWRRTRAMGKAASLLQSRQDPGP